LVWACVIAVISLRPYVHDDDTFGQEILVRVAFRYTCAKGTLAFSPEFQGPGGLAWNLLGIAKSSAMPPPDSTATEGPR